MKKMKGYVKNMTHLWAHVMKRAIGPGQKIPLAELYEQYGAKHNIEQGEPFITWLTEVKLKDRNKWKVFTEDDKPAAEVSKEVSPEKQESVAQTQVEVGRGGNVAPPVTKDMEVADVVELSVRKAREVVPEIQDMQLLKYAIREANQRTGKDSLCRILRKRIMELETTTRR